MNEHLFNHVNIKSEMIHILNGMAEEIEDECKHYDKLIIQADGIDIQVLGIGNNACTGFNEPQISFEK